MRQVDATRESQLRPRCRSSAPVRITQGDGNPPGPPRGRVRNDPPEAVKRWKRTHLLKNYGLTPELFDRLLGAQDYACAMCHEPFGEDEPICIDHDHNCCKAEKRSCGECVRGLLCLSCNTALGIIERKYDLAGAYLANPPGRFAVRGEQVA